MIKAKAKKPQKHTDMQKWNVHRSQPYSHSLKHYLILVVHCTPNK